MMLSFPIIGSVGGSLELIETSLRIVTFTSLSPAASISPHLIRMRLPALSTLPLLVLLFVAFTSSPAYAVNFFLRTGEETCFRYASLLLHPPATYTIRSIIIHYLASLRTTFHLFLFFFSVLTIKS